MATSESDISDTELYCSSASVTEYDSSNGSFSEVEAMPYQFESRCEEDRQVSRANEDENVELDLRLNILDWCKCSNCVIFGSERECRCCHEIDTIFEKVDSFNADHAEDGMIRCITEHPGFSSVCLDPYVLETAYYQYRQAETAIRDS